MKTRYASLGVILLLAVLKVVCHGQTGEDPVQAGETQWMAKVDPWVLERVLASEKAEVLLMLKEQAELSAAAGLNTKEEKGAHVFLELTRTAERTQKPLLTYLESASVPHRPFWVANMIWVQAGEAVLKEMASHPQIAYIHGNPSIPLKIPLTESGYLSQPMVPRAVEWNISKARAPEVWGEGVTGAGAVVGGHDTGYQWDHPALKRQYRGWEGTVANHDYNWHDAVHAGGGVCGADSPFPCDDYGHGTHTMGIAVGDDGLGNQIGMAPGAKWIGCRNMNQGFGSPASYSECYQWFIAPTRIDGTGADPSRAPDVVNNSWSCSPSEGCTNVDVLKTVVENVRAAGIMTVNSAGNSGTPYYPGGCGTISEPAAIYEASFTVGNTTSSDTINDSSSRGPVTVDGSNRNKPDVTAPGTSIRSSTTGNGYTVMSGTSMAAPHVAGLAALLISANPGLSGSVSLVEDMVRANAVPLTTNQGCGEDGPDDVPNNVFGWGRIDAHAAYLAATARGSLAVILAPQAALNKGARWKVDQSDWQKSGNVISNLFVGNHMVAFKDIPDWKTPRQVPVMVQGSKTTSLTALYRNLKSQALAPLMLLLE